MNLFKRAVFLDRDGVINQPVVKNGKPYPPSSLAEFALLPGVATAVEALHEAGFLIVVVTNQPDVATGVQRLEVVEAMHRRLSSELTIDEIRVCYHTDQDACHCRKPKPGMLLDAASKYNIDLTKSYLVGDRWRDISAGKAVGCFTFFIDYGYQESAIDSPDVIVNSLEQASHIILKQLDQSFAGVH